MSDREHINKDEEEGKQNKTKMRVHSLSLLRHFSILFLEGEVRKTDKSGRTRFDRGAYSKRDERGRK